MDDVLLDLVLERLERAPLTVDANSLLLAACESDTSLAAHLSGVSQPTVKHAGESGSAEPAGAHLRTISVQGFRGVGPASTLELEPGPGLTLVVGRNGSGKSSFAEGLEVLLTGGLRRWNDANTTAWQDGWRNLHEADPVRICAELLVEDAGPTTVERTWDSGAALADSHATMQVAGRKRTSLDQLGWREALATYRPFLSHSELEAFFNGPSRLYDLLSAVLGLDDLAAAEKRLTAARKDRKSGVDAVNLDLPGLLERLDSVDDERARACREALTARRRDTGRALGIATGGPSAQPDTMMGRLRQLSQLTVPPETIAVQAVTELRAAAGVLEQAAASQAGQARALAELLRSALDHYHAHGPGACPVCGRASALDDAWRDRSGREIDQLDKLAAEASEADTKADVARRAARGMFLPVPAALAGPGIGSADPEQARTAWESWDKNPDKGGAAGLRQLADHIEKTWPVLHRAVTALVAAAGEELRTREDLWAPVAAEVAAWSKRAVDAEIAAQVIPALQKAIAWLKDATDDIRNARLKPLGEQARAIWAQLRQESNVDLGAIRLSGSGPRRRVDVNVCVDGSPGTALEVMSQGEVNALALSVFLPRATLPASRFRFLVIDDPVQAMDPAKVEGLARVLADVARSRQVIVFTHDDRLPEAVRRLGIAARILEVTRRPGSIVDIRLALTPVDRMVKDAGALCADEEVPADVAAQVVPGLCRLAVEAAFTEAFRRRQLRTGARHADVEAAIEAAGTSKKRAALALFADASRAGEVLPRLDAWDHAAANTFRAVNEGAHTGQRGALRDLVGQTRRLTNMISAKLP